MTEGSDSSGRGDETNPLLAELTEEITRRLQAGEVIEPDAYAAQHPDCAGTLRELLPTMEHLIELGRTVARESQAESHPESPGSFGESVL